MNKVIVYIDGSNLYYGLVDRGWRRYLWLDVQKMAESLMDYDKILKCTKYFTARIIVGDQAKKQRQATYIDALNTLQGLEVIEGKYHDEPYKCYDCGFMHHIPSEKMTDVNIAIEMITDAFKDNFDTALLISADADLVPAIKTIRKEFALKRIIAALPPKRYSKDLVDSVNSSFGIGRSHFKQNQLPEQVIRTDGFILERPRTWA
jgi:uncharacterized LabA/DUF88 family protein